MLNELGKSNVRHETFKTLESDSHEETDAFIAAHIPTNAYEKKLTQSEDVTVWIDDPLQISLIQPNLVNLASHLQAMPRPWKILDVGCYAGYVYDYLTKAGTLLAFSYVGIDIREEAVAGAKAHHLTSANAQFRVGDLFKLMETYQEGEFDICFSARVLVHLPNFKDAMRNILFCARKHTFIVIPLARRGRCELRKKIWLDTGVEIPYVYRHFSLPMISDVAKKHRQSFTLFDTSCPYATVLFSRKRSIWSQLNVALGKQEPGIVI
jgi:SAM-dependent methyltransferase